MPDIFISNNQDQEHASPQVIAQEKEVVSSPSSGNKIHLLTSFCLNPIEIDLLDIDKNDSILLFLRRDLVTNVPWILEGLLAVVAPIIAIALANAFNFSISIPSNFTIFIALFYYLLVLEFFFLNFLNWFFNISLVTKTKVLDIDFRILFSKNVASTKIAQIEDVSLNQIGIIRAIFDYGDVLVQTAGTQDTFDFQAVPQPEKVVHIISDLIGSEQHA